MKTLDDRGFTMLLVIIITSIIFIMTIPLTNITSGNYRMKKLNSTVKKNFYVAEAGLEEAYMILDIHVQESIEYSNRKLIEYENKIKSKDTSQANEYLLDEVFCNAYKEYIKNVESKLNDVSEYKLNKVDGYTFLVDASISGPNEKDEFILILTVSFKDSKVIQRIKVRYDIEIPKRGEYMNSEDIIKKIDWINLKW